MACKVVDTWDWDGKGEANNHLENKSFSSHVAVAKVMADNTSLHVQETNGRNAGWFRKITREGDSYSVSIPLMDY